MTDLEKILASSGASFVGGLLLGVFFEKYRERKVTYKLVLDEYLKALKTDTVNDSDYCRFSEFQRAGAWRLSLRELGRLADDVRGRGFRDPYSAWSKAFSDQKDFPKGFLRWAKNSNVDLSRPDIATQAILARWALEIFLNHRTDPKQASYFWISSKCSVPK